MSVSTDDVSGMRRRDDESSSDEVISNHVKDLYDTKTTSKVIRVLTVLAYLLSVSFAAILLSVYYIFIWDPPRNHAPAASPLRDNSSHWTASVTMATHFTVPGDSTVRTSIGETSPYSPPLPPPPPLTDDDDDDYTSSVTPAATATTTPPPPPPLTHTTQHHSTSENHTISKNNNNRIHGRDPQ